MARANDGGCFAELIELVFRLLNKIIEFIVELISKGSRTTIKIINTFFWLYCYVRLLFVIYYGLNEKNVDLF